MPGINPAVGDVVLTRALCYNDILFQLGENTASFLVTAIAFGGAALQDIANNMDSLLSLPYRSWMPVESRYVGVGCANITGPRTLEYVGRLGGGQGTAAGNQLPTQTSGLIRKGTGLARRQNRGRMYPPFPASVFSSVAGQLNPSGVLALQAIAIGWGPTITTTVTGGHSTTMTMMIQHRDGTIGPLVTDLTPVPLWATQRRRGQEGKINPAP